MGSGLSITLPQPFSSDIIFLQDAAAGKPEELVEPGEFKLMSATPEAGLFSVTAQLAWIPSEHARSYRVSVSDSAEFTQTVATEMAATSSLAVAGLPPARKLYWKVEAISPGGTRSNAGGPGTFTTPDHVNTRCGFCLGLGVEVGHGWRGQLSASRHEPPWADADDQREALPERTVDARVQRLDIGGYHIRHLVRDSTRRSRRPLDSTILVHRGVCSFRSWSMVSSRPRAQ